MAITAQESWIERDGGVEVAVPGFLRELVEEVAIQARKSEYVDQNSGVSARLPIALHREPGLERRAPRPRAPARRAWSRGCATCSRRSRR